jgi:PKD repeat protein
VSVSDGDITDTDTVNVTVQPVAAGTTDILVTAGGETLAPDETTNVTVAVSNADGGVGSADLRVELTNSSVAAIQDVTIEADAGFQNVRGDETGQDINFAAATTETDTGEVIFLRVTIKATDAGSTDLVVVDNTQDSVDGVDVGDEAGNSYIIENIGSASLTVAEEDETPPPIDGFANAPTDPDGDGLYEDVNGDSEFNIVDVQALFANLDDETVENNPDKFDFNQDGDVDVVDVQKLFNEVNSK